MGRRAADAPIRAITSLQAELDRRVDDLVAIVLLETELRRFAVRVGLDQATVTDYLESITLLAMPRSLFRAAGVLTHPNLRSLDALHLAAASRLGVDAVVTYDERLAVAARREGLSVLSPGRD